MVMGDATESFPSPLPSPRLRRHRSLASSVSMRCCSSLCDRSSLCGYDFDEIFCCLPAGKDGFSLPQKVQQQQSVPSPRLRRQRSLASSVSMRCCSSLCGGRSSLCGYDFDEIFCRLPAGKDGFSLPQKVQQQQSGWHDSWKLLGSRRKSNTAVGFSNGADAWPSDTVLSDDLYYKPPRWKLFFRKLKAETRRMNCSRPAPPGFHYDALTYAMNFDDGCWMQKQGHPTARFSGSISMESSSLKVSASVS